MKFFSLEPIKAKKARYNIIFGERSNGKTYAVLLDALKEYAATGQILGVIRRWEEDYSGPNSAKTMYDSLIYNGEGKNMVREIFNGEYDGIEYYAGRYYLTRYSEEERKTIRDPERCVAAAFALNCAEHYKSGSYPNVKTILFDEFIATKGYLIDEFRLFMSVLSTIIRHRDDVVVYMCGNTTEQSRYNPYFREMGITKAKTMQQGTIDVYEYGSSGLRVAVEYSDSPAKKKASDVYFAFDNPALKMITEGAWELDIYPHAPCKWTLKDVVFTYLISWDGELYQADVVELEDKVFTFIHEKTTPIRDEDHDLIFSPDWDPRPNHRRRITRPVLEIEKKIAWFFATDKVFYQDNLVGDSIAAYLDWSKKAG